MVCSTELAAAAGPRYPRVLARHRDLIDAAVRRAGGRFLAHAATAPWRSSTTRAMP
jgi:hypothetical protein